MSALIPASLLRLEYECLLAHTAQGYFCSIDRREKRPDVDIFFDLDVYEISLCPDNSSDSCEVLEEEYRPSLNSKRHGRVKAEASRCRSGWISFSGLVRVQFVLLLPRT